jgi:DUF4097 and DUF4098 domain-containing protein YvlB
VNTQRFEPSDTLELLQADHDVAIKGWDEQAIKLVLDGEVDECEVEQQEGTLVLKAHIPLAIHVPRGTTVTIGEASDDLLLRDLDGAVRVGAARGDVSVRSGQASVSLEEVHGDLAVEHLNGPLSVSVAHGDVHLSQVGAVNLGRVHGDFNARAVAGDLRIGAANGEVRVRDVAGPLTLEEGQGSFNGHDLAGGMDVHSLQGDLSLKTALTPGLAYIARANGDIAARFPEGTSAQLTLEAEGQLSVKGLEVDEREDGRATAHVGQGEAQVTLRAGGDMSVRVRTEDQDEPWVFALEGLSEQIQAEISQHMGKLNLPDFGALASREVEKAMRQVEREIEKAQRKAEQAARRAQEHARAAEERARRAQERAQEKARQFQAKFERKWGPPPDAGFGAHGHAPHGRAAGPSRPKPSAEEQLAILRMLQEGKISTEEAETLLKALGI